MTEVEIELPADRVGAFVGPPEVLAVGPSDGPLAGVRVAVKDVIDVAGRVTGAGNPTFAEGRAPATRHAAAVQRLVDAGAAVVGKTVLDELAYSLDGRNLHHGTPINVAAPGHLAGGSSSGSAAAVAAGEAELGLATDTGGSIRVPASYCGLYGWRPTHGSVDAVGVVPLARSFDTVGLLARDPNLLRTGAGALIDPGRRRPRPRQTRPLRVQIWSEALATTGEATRAAFVDALFDIAAAWEASSRPTTMSLDADLPNLADAFRVLQGREAWEAHGAWISTAEPDLAPDIAARFAAASTVTDAQVHAANATRVRWRALLAAALADGMVLVLPAAAGPAPSIGASQTELDAFRASNLLLAAPAGVAGVPVVVVPGGSVDDLPLGLAFVGAAGTDLDLLGLAATLRPPT